MNTKRTVLCVLRDEQRDEYAEELARLGDLGPELVFQSSPDLAIPLMKERDPDLLIVGMDLGLIEGIEFLAMVMAEFPELEKPLIMLPDKGDGLPPVAHARDKVTGRSSVDSIDFEGIAALIAPPPAPRPSTAKRAEVAPTGTGSAEAAPPSPAPTAAAPVLAASRAALKPGATLVSAGPVPPAMPARAPASAALSAAAKAGPARASAASRRAADPAPAASLASLADMPPQPSASQGQLAAIFDDVDTSGEAGIKPLEAVVARSPEAPAPPSDNETGAAIPESPKRGGESTESGPLSRAAGPSKRPKWVFAAAASAAAAAVMALGYLAIAEGSDQGPAAQTGGGDKPGVETGAAENFEPSETRTGSSAEPKTAPQGKPETAGQAPQGARADAVEAPEPQPADATEDSEPARASQEQGPFSQGAPLPGRFVMPLAFAVGRDTPVVTDSQRWDAIVRQLERQSDMRIVLTGHTSVLGNTETAKGLGLLRAKRTKELLIQSGIGRGRFRLRSAGARRPIASNNTESGRNMNRRVAVELRPIRR